MIIEDEVKLKTYIKKVPVWCATGMPIILMSLIYLSPSKKMAEYSPNSGHNHFLPHSFQFIFHCATYHSILQSELLKASQKQP